MLQDGRMTNTQAAEYLGFHPGTLNNMRVTGDGPKFMKVRGKVFYRRGDLDAWLDSFGVSKTTAQARLHRNVE